MIQISEDGMNDLLSSKPTPICVNHEKKNFFEFLTFEPIHDIFNTPFRDIDISHVFPHKLEKHKELKRKKKFTYSMKKQHTRISRKSILHNICFSLFCVTSLHLSILQI